MLNYPVRPWLLPWDPLASAPAPQIPSPLPSAACDLHPCPPGREGSCTSREELNPAHLSHLIYGSIIPGKAGGIFSPCHPPQLHLPAASQPQEHHSLTQTHGHLCPAPQIPNTGAVTPASVLSSSLSTGWWLLTNYPSAQLNESPFSFPQLLPVGQACARAKQ